MKLLSDSSNLVLAGAWNPAILSPAWIAKEALGIAAGTDFPVSMQLPVIGEPSAFPARYSFEGVAYSAAPHAVTIFLQDGSEGVVQKSISLAAKLAELLPHTPLTGFGFNFAFTEEQPSEKLLSTFAASNNVPSFITDVDAVTVAQQWGAAVLSKGRIINMTIKYEGGTILVNFNVHFEVTSASDACTKLKLPNIYSDTLEDVNSIIANLQQ